jgi:hypothetical protein
MLMFTQINNQSIVKAVGAIVQDQGILGSPKGQWHGWISESFVFILKLFLLAIMVLLSLAVHAESVSINNNFTNQKSIGSKNIIDLMPVGTFLTTSYQNDGLLVKSELINILARPLSQHGGIFSTPEPHTTFDRVSFENVPPGSVNDFVTISLKVNQLSYCVFQSKMPSELVQVFDESHSKRNKISSIMNLKSKSL